MKYFKLHELRVALGESDKVKNKLGCVSHFYEFLIATIKVPAETKFWYVRIDNVKTLLVNAKGLQVCAVAVKRKYKDFEIACLVKEALTDQEFEPNKPPLVYESIIRQKGMVKEKETKDPKQETETENQLTQQEVVGLVTVNHDGLVSGKALHSLDEKRQGYKFYEWREKFKSDYNIEPLTKILVDGKTDYLFTLDDAKDISMTLPGQYGTWTRSYFRECEKRAQEPLDDLDQLELIVRNAKRQRDETKKLNAKVEAIKTGLGLIADERIEPVKEVVETHTVKHGESVLTASQRSICQQIFDRQNATYQASTIHAYMKRAAKRKFLPLIPANDCTWHDIKQKDFEDLIYFFENYLLNDIDVASLKKFRGTSIGQADHEKWIDRQGFKREGYNAPTS